MDPLQLREEEVFVTLQKLKGLDFVIIGGYAANAYALPRFSIDCDIVIKTMADLDKIDIALRKYGYSRDNTAAKGNAHDFSRYMKSVADSFSVSFDVLIGKVMDRQTNVSVPADWIFKNSELRLLKGKTITDKLEVRIINLDALVVMKAISCRATDIRDIFMMSYLMRDKKWIRAEIASRYDFNNRFRKIEETVTSKKFRDGLQGVYGLIDDKTFQNSINAIESLKEA